MAEGRDDAVARLREWAQWQTDDCIDCGVPTSDVHALLAHVEALTRERDQLQIWCDQWQTRADAAEAKLADTPGNVARVRDAISRTFLRMLNDDEIRIVLAALREG